MKIPLIIAHGESALLLVLALGVGASLIGLCAVVVGLAKKKQRRSMSGITLGTLALAAGILFCSIHRFQQPFFDLLMLALTAPLILGVIGIALSLRHENELTNQFSERAQAPVAD